MYIIYNMLHYDKLFSYYLLYIITLILILLVRSYLQKLVKNIIKRELDRGLCFPNHRGNSSGYSEKEKLFKK